MVGQSMGLQPRDISLYKWLGIEFYEAVSILKYLVDFSCQGKHRPLTVILIHIFHLTLYSKNMTVIEFFGCPRVTRNAMTTQIMNELTHQISEEVVIKPVVQIETTEKTVTEMVTEKVTETVTERVTQKQDKPESTSHTSLEMSTIPSIVNNQSKLSPIW